MELHLGVIDVPYVNAPSKRQRKVRANTVTTGDVAHWLEAKYGVMEHFVDAHEADIAGDLEKGLVAALQGLAMGAPANVNVFGSATSKIEDRFKQFIAQAEMDALGVPGVPTQAAIDRALGKRRGARFKRRRRTNARPISFYDTGAYVGSFKTWVE